MTSSASWNYITQEAKKPARSWTYKECVAFHYFNPNGLYCRKYASDKKIYDLVERGACRAGAMWAYGGMSNFETDTLVALHSKNRVGRIEYEVAVEMLEDACIKAEAFIADAEKQEAGAAA